MSENKKSGNNTKKLLYILVPVIAVIAVVALVIVIIKSGNGGQGKPIVVTDSNGVAVTDVNGEPVTYYQPETIVYEVTDSKGEVVTDAKGEAVTQIGEIHKVTTPDGVPVTNEKGEDITYIAETEIVEITDAEGNKQTTVVYNEVEVTVPVTDEKGEVVTEENGEIVTEAVTFVPDITYPTNPPTNSGNVPGVEVVGSTAIPVTDGQGNTAVDESGNILTTIGEVTTIISNIEPAEIDWQASLGGSASDYFSSVVALADGSYITSVVTNSTDGDFKKFAERGYKTPYTVLTRYNKSGEIGWQEALGSDKKNSVLVITSLVADKTGGFYAVGYGNNLSAKINEEIIQERSKGYYDGVVYKFNDEGKIEWMKTFGTSTVDLFNGAALTSDGGIVVAGSVGNNDKDAKGFGKPELESAACIVKYNAAGELVWKNIVGGNQDAFNGVVEGTDGNIYCVGNFYSGDLFNNIGSSDGGIVKFDSAGKYIKGICIGGRGIESFTGITACKNGGIAVVGKSNSSDTTNNPGSTFISDLASRGGYDAYIMKYNEDLSMVFATPFRGQNNDELTNIVELEDGSFITVGNSNSSTRDLKGVTTRGGTDIVMASFSKTGNLSWVRSFGGTNTDSASAICVASDGGYVVAGKSLSKDIDMKGYSQYVNKQTIGVIVKFPE